MVLSVQANRDSNVEAFEISYCTRFSIRSDATIHSLYSFRSCDHVQAFVLMRYTGESSECENEQVGKRTSIMIYAK